jgi:hypothetical protein
MQAITESIATRKGCTCRERDMGGWGLAKGDGRRNRLIVLQQSNAAHDGIDGMDDAATKGMGREALAVGKKGRGKTGKVWVPAVLQQTNAAHD